MPPDEMSFGIDDGSKHFNDLPPMYTFEDLESNYINYLKQ